MTTDVRIADANDAPIIALLGRLTFVETFGHLFEQHRDDLAQYLVDTFSVAKIKASLAHPENFFWLALVDNLPVGYAKLKIPSSHALLAAETPGQLQKIYVLQSFLAEGIGILLLNAAREKAVERGADTIWLSVLKDNERAIRFYEKYDFASIGSDTFTIGAMTFNFGVLSMPIR
jgi:ribosomal protein S18 acetylase RimI-like enzyme